MAQNVEQKPKNRLARASGPSHSTGLADHVSAPDRRASPERRDEPPDIIDLVNEMGKMPEEPPAEVPSPSVPAAVNSRLRPHLQDLAGRARDYVEAASSANTRRAYASDWKHFATWCRRQNVAPLPPDPQVVGLYITACASGNATATRKPIPSRLSSGVSPRLTWNYAQRGPSLDRKDRAIATVMAGIRNNHASPPRQKEAILPEDLIAMLESLDRGTLRGLRDRAMLLLGFAGGLRRSEIVGLDLGRDQTEDCCGWIEILDKGMLVRLRGKTGWREVEVGRGSPIPPAPSSPSRPGSSSRDRHGPLFRRVTGQGKAVGPIGSTIRRSPASSKDRAGGRRARRSAGRRARKKFCRPFATGRPGLLRRG